MNEVDAFASARNLPDELRNALANYYNDAWMAHEGKHLLTRQQGLLTLDSFAA